jgi:hypothetical protein
MIEPAAAPTPALAAVFRAAFFAVAGKVLGDDADILTFTIRLG